MVGLAIWLICATIVFFFAVMFGALLIRFWPVTLVIVAVLGVLAWQATSNESTREQALQQHNAPLQQQCIGQVNQQSWALRNQAVNQGIYTSDAALIISSRTDAAILNCKEKYPTE